MKTWQGIKVKMSIVMLFVFLSTFILLLISTFVAFNFYEPVDIIWLADAPIAHRGLHGESVPENSLAAFDAAIQGGYHIELDVRLTKDNVPVVFHDANTLRMTGVKHNLSQITLEMAKTLFLKNTDQTIPTLQEALEFIGGQVSVLVEIKAGLDQKLDKVVEVLKEYSGKFALQFFNPWVAAFFAQKMPNVARGMLYGGIGNNIPAFLLRLRDNVASMIARPNFVSYQKEYIHNMGYNAWRQNGLFVLGYTFKQSSLPTEFAPFIDNVIFDQ